MSSDKFKLLDFLAFPKKSFENLTDNKKTLFAGIVLIGTIDLLLPDVVYNIKKLFWGKQTGDLIFNLGMAALVILILGFIDVFFISIPLFDIFKALKMKEIKVSKNLELDENLQEGQRPAGRIEPSAEAVPSPGPRPTYIKVMKIYIMTHFIISPIILMLYSLIPTNVADSPDWLVNTVLLLYLIFDIWFSAIISRGINVIFKFGPMFGRLTFIIVYIWNFIFGSVFAELIIKWLLMLFR